MARYSGRMRIPRAELIWSALAVAVGSLAAVVVLHTDNVQFAVLFVFVQSAVFGYARPARAWRWACLIALCIPLSLAFNLVVRLPSPRELGFPARLFLGPFVVFFRSGFPVKLADIPDSCMALIPALAGAYCGAWMSRLAAPESTP